MAASSSGFPLPKFRFKVNIEGPSGIGEMSFQEVTGLEQEVEYFEYRTGDDLEFSFMQRAGLTKGGTLSLKRGILSNHKKELSELLYEVLSGGNFFSDTDESEKDGLLTVTVSLQDEKGNNVISWVANNAIPIKLSGASLQSETNEIAIEQIDIRYRSIRIE